jgi:tRNA(fMet)-specific endonuclease VapC
MLQYLFDTDHLTLYDHAHPAVWRRFCAEPLGTVGISAVSAEESLRGRLAVLSRHLNSPIQVQAYARLIDCVQLLQEFPVVAFDIPSEREYQQLRAQRLRIGRKDLRIASIALVNRLILVTRNKSDFIQVPGLTLEDWSV